MKEQRIKILMDALEDMGIHREDLEARLRNAPASSEADQSLFLLERLQKEGLLPDQKAEEMKMALRFSEEAAGVFLKAHLEQKPVVLLLKGLEEVLKSIGRSTEHDAGHARPAASIQVGHSQTPRREAAKAMTAPIPAESKPLASPPPPPIHAPGEENRTLDEAAGEDDPGEKTEPFEAVSPASLWLPPDKTTRIRDAHYEVIVSLGRGRLTEAFKARDRARGDLVVLKLFPPGFAKNPELVEALFSGVRQAIRLNHPSSRGIRQIVLAESECYLVCEFVEGTALKTLLASGVALPPQKVLALLEPVLEALREAHDLGLPHGSLHPGNILLESSGSVRVLDFGLGGLAETEPGLDPPEGPRIYRAHYLSPERHGSNAPPTAASDVYELGILLYHGLCGRPPFPDQDLERLAHRHARDPLPPMPSSLGDLGVAGANLLARMTAKTPTDRPVSISGLLQEIQQLKNLPCDDGTRPAPQKEAPPATPAPRGPELELESRDKTSARRGRHGRQPTPGGWMQTAATVLLVLVILGVAFAWSRRDPLQAQPKDLAVLAKNLSVRGERDEDVASKLAAAGDRAIPVLQSLLRDGQPGQHVPALRTLADIRTPAAEAELFRHVEHPNPEVRGEVLMFLSPSRRPDTLDVLARGARDPDATVRRKAMIALGHYGGAEALQIVRTLGLPDPDLSVRKQAEVAWQSLSREAEKSKAQ